MTRPLLFLDVDGTLLPFGGDTPVFGDDPNPLLARLDPAHGPRLAALAYDLVWATTWMDDANDVLSPRLGLPYLPVVNWPDESEVYGRHWKTGPLVDWAAGRPFAWVDDEITDADRDWVAAYHPAPALLLRVDARQGIIGSDYERLDIWTKGI